MQVLLIDDDKDFATGLAHYFAKNNINTVLAQDVAAGEQALSNLEFDAVLLDVMLPGQSGFDFLPTLREISSVPVIMLTALGEEDERVTGFELGADDYITKPFSAKELVARLRAIERRRTLDQAEQSTYELDDLFLLPRQYKVRVGNSEIELTAVECRLLQLLMKSTERPLPRQTLYKHGLFRDESPLDRSLDVHISNLRRKLGPHPTKGSRIKAIRGLGYTLTT